jgi:hypothetical protein
MKLKLLVASMLLLIAFSSSAQVYFVENFDGAFTSSPTSPGAPSGWQQTRIQPAPTQSFERDWRQNFWTGSAWLLFNNGTVPTGAVSGIGVLNIDDVFFGQGTLVRSERVMESPTINLSTSTNPYVRFFYFNNNDPGRSLNVRVVLSADNGQTWHTLSNVLNGFQTLPIGWNRINVRIPNKYRTSQVKVGFAIVNRWGAANPFIDSLTVEEFTPTTITSNGTGDWHSPSTWIGGVVPTADHHVAIQTGHIISINPGNTSVIARCQNLTVNGTLTFGTGTITNNIQIFGNLVVNGTGSITSAINAPRTLVVGGNITFEPGSTVSLSTSTANQGQANQPPAFQLALNAGTIFMSNGGPIEIRNNGATAPLRIPNFIFNGSGNDTVTFVGTQPIFSYYTIGLRDGFVNPNGVFTVGNSHTANTTVSTMVGLGAYTQQPLWNGTNMVAQITNRYDIAFHSFNTVSAMPRNVSQSFESEIDAGFRAARFLAINTVNNVNITSSIRVGQQLILTRGIFNTTTAAHIFYAGTSATNLQQGVEPDAFAFPNNQGSYINGPIRVSFPTNNQTFNIPLGVGSAFNPNALQNNARRLVTIAPGGNFPASTSILFSLEPSAARGTVNGLPTTTLMPARTLRMQRLNTGDIPNTSVITMRGINTLNPLTTDSLQALQSQTRLVRSTSLNGPWNVVSNSNNINSPFLIGSTVQFTSNTLGTIASAGEFFTFATTAPPIVYDSIFGIRDTQRFAGGTPLSNLAITQVVIRGTGTVTRDVVQQLQFSTAGTTNLAPILRAKVLYTGNIPTLTANATQYGASINGPSGTMLFNDNVYLRDSLNYFWLVYDLDGSSPSGDSLTAVPISAIVGGTTRSIASPTPGFRVAVAPMLFQNANAIHTNLDLVETQSIHNPILRVRVNMTPLGSSVQLNAITLDNSGSTSAILDVDSTTVWFTGSNPEFVNPQYIGGVDARNGSFTVPVQANLLNDSNFIWITYNIPFFAGLGNVVDAQLVSLNIGGANRTPIAGNPPGNRKIRARYCDSEVSDSNDTDIGRIVMRDGNDTLLVNGLGCGTGQLWAKGTYTNNTTIPGISIPKGRTISMNICNASNNSTLFQNYAMVLIDLNQNGIWEPEDSMWSASVTNNVSHTATFTLPCHVDTGQTRMRVMLMEAAAPLTVADACQPFTYGETEDYTIRMVDYIPRYDSAFAMQQTGLTPPGTADVAVLQIPIQASVATCNDFRISQLFFSTNGTTTTNDLAAAKLYRTNGNTFNTSRLISTVTSPNGAFSFTINDSLLNGTNFYWLAYDIDTGASANNLIDATFDSLVVNGIKRFPTISNPAGSKQITAPMTYVSSEATHPDLLRMERNTTNNIMMRVRVDMSSIGAPVALSQLQLSLAGSNNPTTNLDSVSIWYTGNNNAFINPQFFGAVIPQNGIFQVNGLQNLANDSNFFWITVRIRPTANIGDTVDIVAHRLVIAGIERTPNDTAPAGSRVIKGQYCSSEATFADDAEILQVTIGSLSNTSNCITVAPGAGSVLRRYSNFTTLPPPTLVAGKPLSFTIFPRTCDGNFTAMIGIWIDLNDDGDFTDAGEQVYVSPNVFNYNINSIVSGMFTIPCAPFTGIKRMRVIMEETPSIKTLLPCGSYLYGETEDYVINLTSETPTWQFTTAQQLTDTAEAATTHPILRIPVKADANLCVPSVISQLRFATAGTTQISDISNARLFKTATPIFNNAILLAQTPITDTLFAIQLQDTLGFDTTYYWLAYDVNASAANNNFLDARFDSLLYNGTWQTPVVGNPAGSVRIFTIMKYVSSTSFHPTTKEPEQGQSLVRMLTIPVQMTTLGVPLSLTQIQLSVNGSSNPLNNIDSIQVWSTGNDSTFTTPTLFAQTGVQSGTFVVNGSTGMLPGTNYIWVTYKVASTATIGDTLDAQVLSLTIGNIARIPTITSPAGFRIIRPNYCTPNHTNGTGAGNFISSVQLNTLNYMGTASSAPFFTFFDTIQTTLEAGGLYSLTISAGTQSNNSVVAWIDFNSNGFFESNEKIGEAIGVAASPSTHVFQFYVPLQVTNLLTRLRVLIHDSVGVNFTPCGTYLAGETKDFVIFLNQPTPSQMYVWNTAGTGNFTTASNWTPTRTLARMQDVLVFNSGTSTTVSQVAAQKVAGMIVSTNTRVNWDGATLFITDSMELWGIINVQNNTALGLGDRTNGVVKTGSITGSGFVNGRLTRWVDTVSSTVVFPIAHMDSNRNAIVQFLIPPTASGTLTASFIQQSAGNNGLPYTDSSFNMNKAMEEGYWSILPDNGLSGGAYQLGLIGNGVRGVNNLLAAGIAYRSNSIAPWTAVGGFLSATGTLAQPQFNRTNLTAWGQYTAVSDSAINPLPVAWLRVEGTRSNMDAQLNWTVANELGGEWYSIERSLDGITYQPIENIAIEKSYAGVLSRNFVDIGIFNQNAVAYYRIGNYSADGLINYSPVVQISRSELMNWKAYIAPNPFTENVYVTIQTQTGGTAKMEISNVLGALVSTQDVVLQEGAQIIPIQALQNSTAGVYYITIKQNGTQQVLKAVKQ